MTQYSRPSADSSNPGSWTDQGGGSTNVYTSINDATAENSLSSSASSANDADYISSPSNPFGSVYVSDLGDMSDPLISTGHILWYRYAKSGSGGRQIDLSIELQQNGTTIASWSHTNVSDIFTTTSQTLTETQADSISDYSQLQFFVSASTQGGGQSRNVYVSWVEFECPDAPTNGNNGQFFIVDQYW